MDGGEGQNASGAWSLLHLLFFSPTHHISIRVAQQARVQSDAPFGYCMSTVSILFWN